ncbi:MAG: 3-carboxyethylcatechol 2,3-dioxygenase [Comamonadaceae bacterium]|nr:MAG: 3-carboxyethylcatechol 2,3-dioxygenase [Comamonadaceae bacterium]
MPLAMCCMSHSPLLDITEQSAELTEDVLGAIASARDFVTDFDPEVVVLFAPDHYNGFFYRLMPPFCLGLEASGIGDYGSADGPLNVPRAVSEGLANALLGAGLDIAVSASMELDHGAIQPLEKLFGEITAKPVVPIFINSVAAPLGPMSRVRKLGEAVGEYFSTRNERVLFVGSGGLSHDPPVPTLASAPAPVAERLVSGRPLTPPERTARQSVVIKAAAEFAAGGKSLRPLNPVWDDAVLNTLGSGTLVDVDAWSNEWIESEGGGSAHEIRSWVAAHAALSAAGSYQTTSRYYRAIPEYIAGFAITTAIPEKAPAER